METGEGGQSNFDETNFYVLYCSFAHAYLGLPSPNKSFLLHSCLILSLACQRLEDLVCSCSSFGDDLACTVYCANITGVKFPTCSPSEVM